jgi:hypothetical protein
MRRIARGQFAAVIRAYMASPEFQKLAPATKANYSRALFRAEAPEMLGSIGIGMLRPAIMQAYLDGLASRPGNAQVARTALKRVESWALVRDLLPHPIMTGTAVVRSKGGRKPWTDGASSCVSGIQICKPVFF